MTDLPARGPAEVAEAYDAWAPAYDSVENATRDLDARVLRAQDFDLAGGHVLELGCGTGKNTAWLAERAARVTALDASERMMEVARRRVPASRVTWVRHDLRERWPVADGTVDLVTADLVLEHVADLGPVFREAARVLRPGGECWVCELHPARQLAGVQARFDHPDTGEPVRVAAWLHDVSDYVNTAVAAGLRVVATGDWRDDPSDRASTPRLFSLRSRRE